MIKARSMGGLGEDVGARVPALLAVLAAVLVSLLGSWVPALLCLLPLAAIDAWPTVAWCWTWLGGALRRWQRRPVAPVGQTEPRLRAHRPPQAPQGVSKSGPHAATDFEVCRTTPRDVAALSELYRQDYVDCHRRLHGGRAGAASASEWEEALGPVDFEALIGSLATRKGGGPVRLLKCVERGRPGSLLGYVLYELREKGAARRRQRYCELVNIVVREEHRGCGAGRYLFDAMCRDLAQTAVAQADDLRLFVAKSNAGPLDWYRRLGFSDAGWQSELIGGARVDFLRMLKRAA